MSACSIGPNYMQTVQLRPRHEKYRKLLKDVLHVDPTTSNCSVRRCYMMKVVYNIDVTKSHMTKLNRRQDCVSSASLNKAEYRVPRKFIFQQNHRIHLQLSLSLSQCRCSGDKFFPISLFDSGPCTPWIKLLDLILLPQITPSAITPALLMYLDSFCFNLKIGRASDVWSLGCILYMMVYGRTPFQHITNHVVKLQCIMDPSHVIEFPDIKDKRLLDVMKVSLDKERIQLRGYVYQTLIGQCRVAFCLCCKTSPHAKFSFKNEFDLHDYQRSG